MGSLCRFSQLFISTGIDVCRYHAGVLRLGCENTLDQSGGLKINSSVGSRPAATGKEVFLKLKHSVVGLIAEIAVRGSQRISNVSKIPLQLRGWGCR